MKRVIIIMGALVVVVLAALVILSYRQAPTTYNAAKETTVNGTVKEVQEFYCPVTNDRGTHLLVTTDKGEMLVHVAMSRYLRKQNITFAPGEKVQVLGSAIKDDAIIARQVTRGAEIYIFRDGTGTPMWQ